MCLLHLGNISILIIALYLVCNNIVVFANENLVYIYNFDIITRLHCLTNASVSTDKQISSSTDLIIFFLTVADEI